MLRRLLRSIRRASSPSRSVFIMLVLSASCVGLWQMLNPHHHSTSNPVRSQDAAIRETSRPAESIPVTSSDVHPSVISFNLSGPVVSEHPFSFTINCPDVCSTSGGRSEVFLLSYVHTAVRHFSRRARIRQTWANESNLPRVRMKTVFVVGLGRRNSAHLQAQLEAEAQQYNDIVQLNFIDTYKNLTYKAIGALRWITEYCNTAKYILKADDDVFVNIFSVVRHLNDIYDSGYRTRLIMCFVWWRGRVLRAGKWRIPDRMLSSDVYPTYCGGLFVLLSADVALAMYRASFHVPFFWVDDVYMTGLLVQALGWTRAGFNHTDIVHAMCKHKHMHTLYTHPTEWYKYAFAHVHDEELFRLTWTGLTALAGSSSIPAPSVVRPGVFADRYLPLVDLFPDDDATTDATKRKPGRKRSRRQ